jgi:(1->4)-alpha-D-glucan 1-alpha-D-glucosylmutase
VDPDNRRPVDWDWREAMLRRLMGGSQPDAATRKLFVTLRLLGLRGRRPELFTGGYEPLEAGDGACAFLRGDDLLVVVAVREAGITGALEAPGGRWRNVLRGEEHTLEGRVSLFELLGRRGVAVFERLGRR